MRFCWSVIVAGGVGRKSLTILRTGHNMRATTRPASNPQGKTTNAAMRLNIMGVNSKVIRH